MSLHGISIRWMIESRLGNITDVACQVAFRSTYSLAAVCRRTFLTLGLAVIQDGKLSPTSSVGAVVLQGLYCEEPRHVFGLRVQQSPLDSKRSDWAACVMMWEFASGCHLMVWLVSLPPTPISPFQRLSTRSLRCLLRLIEVRLLCGRISWLWVA